MNRAIVGREEPGRALPSRRSQSSKLGRHEEQALGSVVTCANVSDLVTRLEPVAPPYVSQCGASVSEARPGARGQEPSHRINVSEGVRQ